MNITITQDNSRIETLGSNGASIILKLYDLAIDSNNTLTLRGNISTAYAYGNLVDYLNNTYGPDLIINATNRYIAFADSAVLSALLAAGFGDGTGITEALASNADFGDVFKNNTNITSFPEFSKFAKMNRNPGAACFINASNLTTIDLSNVEKLSDGLFQGCSSLAINLNIPNLTTFAGGSAFKQSGITGISNLGSVTSIAANTFMSCSSLTSVTVPTTVTSLGNVALGYCASLLTVTGLSNVTTIGASCFLDCVSLSTIDLDFSKITQIATSCFESCTNLLLSGINLSNVAEIGDRAFRNSGLTGALSCPNLTSLGQNAFLNTNITSVDFRGSSITSLPAYSFYKTSLTPITSIRIPSSVIYLGENWINVENTHSSLFLQGFENVMSHANYNYLIKKGNVITPMIYKGTTLTNDDPICIVNNESTVAVNSYYFPNVTTSQNGNTNRYGYLHRSAFTYIPHANGMFTAGLMYFKNISTFGYATFYRCNITDLVINNTTVPSYDTTSSNINYHITEYDSDPFGIGSTTGRTLIGTVWVPDSAVSAYQASPLFSGLTIKGINTKTNGTDYDLPRYATFADWETAYNTAVANGNPVPIGLIEEYM